jgi:hypothetical protein
VKKLRNDLEQANLQKAVHILLSEPAREQILPLFQQFNGDFSALIAHRSSFGFHVKKILDMYNIDWPQDPFDLNRVRVLSEVFEQLKNDESDMSNHS